MPGQDWKNTPTLILPMVYDGQSNITQLAERRDAALSMAMTAVSMQLRRFSNEFGPTGECSIFPAVRDLLINLVTQNEPQPPQPPSQSGQMQSPVSI